MRRPISKTKNTVYELTFDGALLARGFWLYVWEIIKPSGAKVYYIGRTGNSSSTNAQSPFNRMGQHLGFNKRANVLRRLLTGHDVDVNLETFSYRLVAQGPILEEADNPGHHSSRRDVIASLEKALADTMHEAGYEVINTVHCQKPVDAKLFADVRAAFAAIFPKLQGNADKAGGAL
jgi:predicted methyltransferase